MDIDQLAKDHAEGKPLDWEAIKEAAQKSNDFALKSIVAARFCECGAEWQKQWRVQGIGYSPEEKCMCDFLTYHCTAHPECCSCVMGHPQVGEGCHRTTTVTIPLRGEAYAKMAKHHQREENNDEASTSQS